MENYLAINFILTVIFAGLWLKNKFEKEEYEREETANYWRKIHYQSMMERNLHENKDEFTEYWPKECRGINEVDIAYINSFKYSQIVVSIENGMMGYLLTNKELKNACTCKNETFFDK